jgi:hypothetical protein
MVVLTSTSFQNVGTGPLTGANYKSRKITPTANWSKPIKMCTTYRLCEYI